MNWIDAKKKLPPACDCPKSYLVILESMATAQHCKDWAGRGKPELAAFCSQWKPYPWSTRGMLSVAYWMPMPEFKMKWDETTAGLPGRWVE